MVGWQPHVAGSAASGALMIQSARPTEQEHEEEQKQQEGGIKLSNAGVPQELSDLVDKQAIREATMWYFRGCDRLDEELVASAFHSDAIDEHAGLTWRGSAEIAEQILALVTATGVTANHHITTQLIELHGDTAGAETYWWALRTVEQDGALIIAQSSGRYLDRFERRDGVWRIAHRQALIELLAGPMDSSLAMASAARRSREDPSYELLGSLPR